MFCNAKLIKVKPALKVGENTVLFERRVVTVKTLKPTVTL